LLLKNDFDKFEKEVSFRFFQHSFEIFYCLDNPSHVDWLMQRIRPYQNKDNSLSTYSQQSILNSHYVSIRQTSSFHLTQKQDFIHFLQLLSFVQRQKYDYQKLSSGFRCFKFKLRDFLYYAKNTQNYYQLMKMKDFFQVLQQNLIIETFSEKSYKKIVTIPELTVTKSESNIWFVELWVSETLFDYFHPFLFPDFFQNKLKNYEFQILFEIITNFSLPTTRKEINIKYFLDSYPSKLNGARKKKIKNTFIKYIKILSEQKIIQNELLVLPNNEMFQINQFNYSQLSNNDKVVIFETININFT